MKAQYKMQIIYKYYRTEQNCGLILKMWNAWHLVHGLPGI